MIQNSVVSSPSHGNQADLAKSCLIFLETSNGNGDSHAWTPKDEGIALPTYTSANRPQVLWPEKAWLAGLAFQLRHHHVER